MSKQETFAAILCDAGRALDLLEIPFHLLFGTALGALREGRFIAHDYDVDLGVHREEFRPGLERAMHGAGFGRTWSYGSLDDGLEVSFVHDLGVRVDINLLYTGEDGLYTASYGGICSTFPGGKCWYRTAPYSLRLLDFAGGRYLVPPESYLEETYGQDWRTPTAFSYSNQTILERYPSLVRPPGF